MANHATLRMPWAPNPTLLSLWTQCAMKAAFGEAFSLQEDVSAPMVPGEDRYMSFRLNDDTWEQRPTLYIWQPSPQTLELRRNDSRFAAMAKDFGMACAGRAFGASIFNDEGGGPAPLDAPGSYPWRQHAKHYGIWNLGGVQTTSAQEDKAILENFYFGRKALFDSIGAPEILPWRSRMDWAGALRAHWGSDQAPSARVANSALLPFCAYDLPIPEALLSKVSAVGAQRGLGVALMWKSPDAARALCSRFGAALDRPAALGWAQERQRTAHKQNSEPEALRAALEGMEELAQALILSASVARPAARLHEKRVKRSL